MERNAQDGVAIQFQNAIQVFTCKTEEIQEKSKQPVLLGRDLKHMHTDRRNTTPFNKVHCTSVTSSSPPRLREK